MIIKPPSKMHCSFESKEIGTINECITLLKNVHDKMIEYHYTYLITLDDEEFTSGELTDFIMNLENLKRINTMF